MKKKKVFLVKKVKTSIEGDDFGFGSHLMPIKNSLKKEVKISLCSIEGIIYYY